jgi:single-strand DNA-binding protein
MRNLNRIVLTGGLTRDPVLRHTTAGTPVAALRIGYTTQRKVAGDWQDRSNYIDVELWGSRAQAAARHLSKGRQVAIDGRLEWREYETRRGEPRQTHTVIADTIEFLAGGRDLPDDHGPLDPTADAATAAIDDDIPF